MAGRRIDDHKSWMGAAEKGGVMPAGAKMKQERSAEGDGGIMDYPDTTEAIHKDQEMSAGKMKQHPLKSGYRY